MLRDIILKIVEEQSETKVFTGEVSKIDTSKRTCEVAPSNGDAAVFGVRLQASISGKDSFLLVPEKGSEVTVLMFNDHVGCIVQTSKIEKLECIIGSKELSMTSNGIVLKSSTSSLKSEINTLLSELDSLYDLLIQPGLFIAGQIPVTLSPTALPKLTQKKLKIQQLKQAINSILTD